VLNNTSGTNSGDETKASIETKLGASNLIGTDKTIVGNINEFRNTIQRVITFNNSDLTPVRDFYSSSTVINSIVVSDLATVQYSINGSSYNTINNLNAPALTLNGAIWWKITYANGKDAGVLTINGTKQ
jgi:hypothetical protein